ncbi:hypothetical protein BJX76DRAFT_161958 [Aspergillus varians]
MLYTLEDKQGQQKVLVPFVYIDSVITRASRRSFDHPVFTLLFTVEVAAMFASTYRWWLFCFVRRGVFGTWVHQVELEPSIHSLLTDKGQATAH